ncbi:MAG: hypothetical protein KC593_23840 [Myxococcales bacterium]|nr:hypothetical protein [Myxococcales bacterium]MCB9627872.1 hypothetical protein [Sandaracinaceae bacterium]
MFLRKAALRPVPRHAVVDEHFVQLVEAQLDAHEDDLQGVLDRGYAELDRRQPALSDWLAEQLSEGQDELVQSLGYFLVVTVYMTFREAFPTRLDEVDERSLQIALETLSVDEELRANDPTEALDSDDVVAMGQPAVIEFVQHHVEEAIEQAEGEVELEQLDRVYRALLVEVIALSHAVAGPRGENHSKLMS